MMGLEEEVNVNMVHVVVANITSINKNYFIN
jgi:hypothetical protein